jgi:hypothetical protein
MSEVYDKRMAHLRDKYQCPDGKLKVGGERQLPKLTEEQSNDRHYSNRIQELKDKFNLDGLQLEGHEKPSREKNSLAEAVNQYEREECKNLKLAIGSTMYKGKPLNIWYLKSKS